MKNGSFMGKVSSVVNGFVWMIVSSLALAQEAGNVAHQSSGDDGLSLLETISLSLKKNPDIQINEARLVSNKGALQAAGGSFDPLINLSTTINETTNKIRTTNTSLGISQQLRNGMVLGSNITAQSQNIFDTPPAGSATTLGLSITLPMLRGRGEEFVAAAENAAKLNLKKAEYDMYHAASTVVYSAAVAYWNLRTAEEILDAQRESEIRAEQLIKDIQRLIQADERPASDLNLIKANLAVKRTNRLAAEQNLVSARLALADKIGLEKDYFFYTKKATDFFPNHHKNTKLIENDVDLIEQALINRFDLKSSLVHLDVLKIYVNSAKDNLKSPLSITLGLNYIGKTSKENPLLALKEGSKDVQLTANLNYTWDVNNNKSKGNFLSQSAIYDQQSISIRSLETSIVIGVKNAIAIYNKNVKQLAESESTVAIFSKIVENEKTKLKIGTATLLDVVNIENQRQDALLNYINYKSAFAIAISNLRFQTGDLISVKSGDDFFQIEKMKNFN